MRPLPSMSANPHIIKVRHTFCGHFRSAHLKNLSLHCVSLSYFLKELHFRSLQKVAPYFYYPKLHLHNWAAIMQPTFAKMWGRIIPVM